MTTDEVAAKLAAVAETLAQVAASLAERQAPTREPDAWLTVAQVAARLGRDRRWVYRRARSWGFCRKEGRCLLFSARGLERYFNGEA